jgi:hypothetical protein
VVAALLVAAAYFVNTNPDMFREKTYTEKTVLTATDLDRSQWYQLADLSVAYPRSGTSSTFVEMSTSQLRSTDRLNITDVIVEFYLFNSSQDASYYFSEHIEQIPKEYTVANAGYGDRCVLIYRDNPSQQVSCILLQGKSAKYFAFHTLLSPTLKLDTVYELISAQSRKIGA